VRTIFIFLLFLVNFHKTLVSGPENQILIPDWTHFHCPGATLLLYAWHPIMNEAAPSHAASWGWGIPLPSMPLRFYSGSETQPPATPPPPPPPPPPTMQLAQDVGSDLEPLPSAAPGVPRRLGGTTDQPIAPNDGRGGGGGKLM